MDILKMTDIELYEMGLKELKAQLGQHIQCAFSNSANPASMIIPLNGIKC